MSKIELKEKIAAVDLGARTLWEEIDDTNRKILKGEFFILNRYISSVKSKTREIQEHFVICVNEYFNKHWNTLQKHPQLLWQLLCMCSHESKQVFFHEWIGFKRKKDSTKKVKFLLEVYPNHKIENLEVLSKIMSLNDFKQLAKDNGYSDKEIKDLF